MSQKKNATVREKKHNYDYTASTRATTYLSRLAQRKGRRLPVDLEEVHLQMIERLSGQGWGVAASAVIRRAVEFAHAHCCDAANADTATVGASKTALSGGGTDAGAAGRDQESEGNDAGEPQKRAKAKKGRLSG